MMWGTPMTLETSIAGWWLKNPSEQYELVSWNDENPSIRKNKKCSKPPTSMGNESPILIIGE